MIKEEYKGAIEVSVIFHEGQRMFAVPKQPAPVEPVAWCSQCGHKCPQPAPVQQEPVAWWDANLGVFDEKHFDQLQPLYTSPPEQRKPLTDEEIDAIDQSMCGEREFYVAFARGIEAAHNIKENT